MEKRFQVYWRETTDKKLTERIFYKFKTFPANMAVMRYWFNFYFEVKFSFRWVAQGLKLNGDQNTFSFPLQVITGAESIINIS